MTNPPPYKVASSTPIPFREEPAVSGNQAVSTLAITLLLLAAVWALAHFARRKGWLERWVAASSASKPADLGPRVLKSRRVSRQTVVYTIAEGGTRYLLVESNANVSLTALAARPDAVEESSHA